MQRGNFNALLYKHYSQEIFDVKTSLRLKNIHAAQKSADVILFNRKKSDTRRGSKSLGNVLTIPLFFNLHKQFQKKVILAEER
jgi:hypothetical protein